MPPSSNLRTFWRESEMEDVLGLRHMQRRACVADREASSSAGTEAEKGRARGEARGKADCQRRGSRTARIPSRMAPDHRKTERHCGIYRDARYVARRTMPQAAPVARRAAARLRVWRAQDRSVRPANSRSAA